MSPAELQPQGERETEWDSLATMAMSQNLSLGKHVRQPISPFIQIAWIGLHFRPKMYHLLFYRYNFVLISFKHFLSDISLHFFIKKVLHINKLCHCSFIYLNFTITEAEMVFHSYWKVSLTELIMALCNKCNGNRKFTLWCIHSHIDQHTINKNIITGCTFNLIHMQKKL